MTNWRIHNVLRAGMGMVLVLWVYAGGKALAEEKQRTRVEMISDSVVDDSALNFPRGPYGTCINGQTFQQEALISFKGFQYAGYYADGGVLCLARRQLPRGKWCGIRFEDYSIDHDDVHNVVVVGICHGDGTIHLAFDHHNSPLHYRRSVPNLALKPREFEWKVAHFGKTTSALEAGNRLTQLTYPQFFSTPQQKLQLLFRLGGSGNGDWHLAEYDQATKNWTILGMLFSRKGKYKTSSSRCAYPNPLRYGPKSRLHVTWCWRERPRGGPRDLRTNHDLCYAYSDDFGRTWKNNDGRMVAVLGGGKKGTPESISIKTPGMIVRHTRYLWGQMNTTTQFVDQRGRVHVINWQHQQDASSASRDMNTWRYYHYWRAVDGQWHDNHLPFYGRKPQIVLDDACNAYVIFCKGENLNYHGQDSGGNLTIAFATEQTGWTDWETVWASKKHFVGEPLADQTRWNDEGILSIYTQEKPEKPGDSSPLHVLNFRMSGMKDGPFR